MAVDRLAELQKESRRYTKVRFQLDENNSAIPPSPDPTKKEKKHKKEKKKKKSKKYTVIEAPPPPDLKMEKFFNQVNDASENLQRIEDNCNSMENAYKMILQSVSEEEVNDQETFISGFTKSTNTASQNARLILKQMDDETNSLVSIAPPGSGDLRMRKANHSTLLKRFVSLMDRFQEIQRHASSRHQIQIQRQYKIINPEADNEELQEVAQTVGAMTLTSQQVFSIGQTRDPLETLAQMKERRKAVMDIEKGITTLHQLFIDMQNLVDEQGELIDSLEGYMDSTIEYTDVAQDQMIEAVESQKNIRRVRDKFIFVNSH